MTADHFALVTDLLDAGLNLHGCETPSRAQPAEMPPGRLSNELLVAVDDASTRQVIRRELHDYPVLRKDSDVVLAHLAADVGENAVPVLQLNAKHRVGQRLDDLALDLNSPVFFRHVLRDPGSGLALNTCLAWP